MSKKIKDVAAEYDTCVGVRDENYAPGSLAGFLGVEESPVTQEEAWRELWVGMPTYEPASKPEKTLVVNFRSDKDYNDFIEKLNVRVATKNFKSFWYPQEDPENKYLMRFIDEE